MPTPTDFSQPDSGQPTQQRRPSILPYILIGVIVALLAWHFMGRGRASSSLEPAADNIETVAAAADVEVPAEEAVVTEDAQVSIGKVANATGDTWTVMIYLCGTDLESRMGLATQNLQELLSASASPNVNYVIESGGTKTWRNNIMSNRELGLYSVSQGNFSQDGSLARASMGDPSTLSEFIKYSAQKFPADKYMLILWDHGGGSLTGVCADELYNRDVITLPEMRTALSDAGVGFEVIGFDTCLMATLENAGVLRGYGHYMVASEESEPGGGWDYTSLGNFLATSPAADGAQLGKAICDSYITKCNRQNVGSNATLSVVDLTKIDPVLQAFADVSGEFINAASNMSSLNAIVTGARRAERYGTSAAVNMVDLGDLIDNTSSVLGAKGQKVLAALDAAVVYEVHGRMRSEASGLSVYYPLTAESGTDPVLQYSAMSDNLNYMKYIAVMNGTYKRYDWAAAEAAQQQQQQQQQQQPAAEEAPVETGDIKIGASLSVNEDGYRVLSITSGLDAVEHVHTWVMKEENGYYLMLGHDNDITSDGRGRYTENFTGWWMTIGGKWIYADLIGEKKDEYNIYSIPATVNGENANIVASFNFQTEEYQILGKAEGDADRITPLEQGDRVTFLIQAIDPDTKETQWVESGTVSWSEGLGIEETDLPDGTYHIMFEVGDVLGNKFYSESWINSIEGGQVYSD